MIFERARQLREIGAGIPFWANAMKTLRELGLREPVRALGWPPPRRSEEARHEIRSPVGVIIGRPHLQRILFEALREAGGGPLPGKAELLKLFSPWHAPISNVREATPESAMHHDGIYQREPIGTRWGEDRMTLLEDAAHPMAPDVGQGACQTIKDAVVLARSLKERTAHGIEARLSTTRPPAWGVRRTWFDDLGCRDACCSWTARCLGG